MDRRQFIGGIAATTLGLASFSRVSISASNEKLNVIVLWDDSMPFEDTLPKTKAELTKCLSGHEVRFVSPNSLNQSLSSKVDVLINPYGSAFPVSCWKAMLGFLIKGGNFVNLGGGAFQTPVSEAGHRLTTQTNFHKRLGITQYLAITKNRDDSPRNADTFLDSAVQSLPNNSNANDVSTVFEPYLKLSSVNEFPDESGSDGAREARAFPLLSERRRIDGLSVATHVLCLDRIRGDFRGGRWILFGHNGAISAEQIRWATEEASKGCFTVNASTSLPIYRPGETVELVLSTNPDDISVEFSKLSLSIDAKMIATESLRFPSKGMRKGLNAGMVSGRVHRPDGKTLDFTSPFSFLLAESSDLSSEESIEAHGNFLTRGGRPFPVTGTTYMSSSVARRFLFEPNVAEWDADFAQMKATGVNMVRTGIWTGWKLCFDENGKVKESVLRAFEAFLLTAQKHDISVMFTFFAFMPLAFGGVNAYLDPKSIKGQQAFLSAFAARAKGIRGIIWDLINEPSFADPKQLWSCRPNYDEFERAAWRKFLISKVGASVKDVGTELSDRWRLRIDEDPFSLPPTKDFDSINIHGDRRPLRAMDFRLFAQDTFNSWVRQMRDTLKSAGNPAHLVTVGQDEAGIGDSPGQQFHAAELDLTGLHNWWSNDDLLFDSLSTKSPGIPNLVQETGLMFYERQDGIAWRSDRDAAELLERKLVTSFGGDGAGFIQWIWNINPFMDNENESAIGFKRPSGSFKEEFFRFREICKVIKANQSRFTGAKGPNICIVIPQSQMFTPRNLATEAVKKSVRVIHYNCLQSASVVGEYQLSRLSSSEDFPRLIIVPAPRTFSVAGWNELERLAKRGATICVTGFVDEDEYFRPAARFTENYEGALPVGQFEELKIGDGVHRVRFAGEKLQRVEKARVEGLRIISAGEGRFIWSPIPLELGDTLGPIESFYRLGLGVAGILPKFKVYGADESVLIRRVELNDSAFYAIVNEGSRNRKITLEDLELKRTFSIEVSARRALLHFL